ncbi:hypothetical protein Sked_00890 [Sanguibacter keddieii DSM 10542]|uniref:Uncharacterized protein n=1 Tax=Sanguibacter keddieii (strain ATCC 51767 / DSM 10542 / NCFB 3025 / ST-74) TaxID=446469 RepID=D1BI88_SANKS|nr:hypothetical protein [Sanguibacter keddieii]ACZ20062.1 hypothetical protein Sked_00890 [Sanguibacter keddieii DSM 10542]
MEPTNATVEESVLTTALTSRAKAAMDRAGQPTGDRFFQQLSERSMLDQTEW